MPVRPLTVRDWTQDSDEVYLQQVDEAVNGTNRVWVTANVEAIPTRFSLFEQALVERGFRHCADIDNLPRLTVDLFVRVPDEPSQVTFSAGIQADLLETVQVTTNLGGNVPVLPVVLDWLLSAEVPPDIFSVALHITDANDQLVRQVDYPLALGCRMDEFSLAGLDAGIYRAYLIVYNWQTGERLQGGIRTTSEVSDRVLLAEFGVP
jgi:hypothetical protein